MPLIMPVKHGPSTHGEEMLNAFHMRNLRRILNIKWQDKIGNKEMLEMAKVSDYSYFPNLQGNAMVWEHHKSGSSQDSKTTLVE